MSDYPSMKARRLLALLIRAGCVVERQQGSHRWMRAPLGHGFVFAFHDGEEIHPTAVRRVWENDAQLSHADFD